jgi:peptidyl-prolyl cis-trans isomerase SurA
MTALATLLFAACSNEPSETPASAEPESARPQTSAPETSAPAPAASPDEACFSQILVSYAGAVKAGPDVQRTQDEARARAAQLLSKVQGGASFESVASSDSDDERSKLQGGLVSSFLPRDRVPPEMRDGVFALAVGATSPAPVESPRGYHIFQRCTVEKLRARHILVRYHGAKNDRGATRTKDEARHTAEEIHGLATKAGADFAALARERSEDGSASRGGDLGEFGRGMMVPPFEAALLRLQPNEVSDVVESDFGYHVIQRLP